MIKSTSLSKSKVVHFLILLGFITGAIIGSVSFANYLSTNSHLTELVADYGYISAILLGLISGLNFIVPFPPATFVPVYTAAGLYLPILVAMFTLGSTLADIIGYVFGRYSADFIKDHYPKTLAWIEKIQTYNQPWLLMTFVFCYAAFIPFPNEAFIIPLAIIGIKFRTIITPMVCGTLVYHTLSSYGVDSIFKLFVG